MYYRLSSAYALRGWIGTAWTLVKRPENRASVLSRKAFEILLLCDGETQITDEKIKEDLIQFEKQGIIEPREKPKPLDKEQYYKYYGNRYIRNLMWSVTGRCNFRCRHCYLDAPDAMLGEISTQQAFDLIDQMAECGVLQIDITGGEPLVRKDIWQLIDRILAYKMNINFFYSNGWLLDENVLDEFERRGIKPEISVSFDGVGWHDWMRGVPGSEAATLQALQRCYERGFSTDVEVCVHRGNIHTLPQTLEALKRVGVKVVKISNVVQTPLWCKNSQGNALTEQEYIESMLPYITWYYKAGQPMESLSFANIIVMKKNKGYKIAAEEYGNTEKCLDYYLCDSARATCYITPEGRLLPCMPMTASPAQYRFPLIQDIGLKKGLNDSYYMHFVEKKVKDLLAVNAECNACEFRYRCGGGCRAVALIEGDRDLMGCDRSRCLLWKGGYVDRIRQVADEAEAKYGAAQNTL